MNRAFVLTGLVLWLGATLQLSTTRWFSRSPLDERIGPYAVGRAPRQRNDWLSVESFREAVGPLSRAVGGRVARLLGFAEDLDLRLRRVHSPLDVTAFRVRQVGYALAGFGVASLTIAAWRPALPVALPVVLSSPLAAFVVVEQQLANASAAWRRRLFLELPVVAEQVAMLLSAGFSLTAAMNRVAVRGDGACARDLARVLTRVRQGMSDVDALREWAAIAHVPAVDRLVSVLALNREATDLGRLLSTEARSLRRDVQRELTEVAERRGQQVWIPVTVATLVPGVMFLAIPFVSALRLFAG